MCVQNGTRPANRMRERCAILARMKRSIRLILCLCILAVFFAAQLTLLHGRLDAQEAGATPIAATTPLAVTTPEGITADQVNVVARELWCPLCNGVRLDACELKACAQMRDLIAIKLGDGESSESIQQYFVDAYGPQVLGRPPFEGFNWLAWILPPLVLFAGGVLVWMRMRSMVRPEVERGVQKTPNDAPTSDVYALRLEEELKNHE